MKTPKTDKLDKKKPAQRGLGRGLSALMSDVGALNALATPAPKDAALTKATAAPKTSARTQKTPKPAASKKQSPAENETGAHAHTTRGVATLAIDQIVRNPDQPRRYFDKEALAELTQSIADKGVLQPILVRPVPDRAKGASGKPLYQIVAGERRWQASLKAKLEAMPALIRELSDRDVLEIGVVENVQRANLNPIEEALAYRALVDQFGRTQEDIAQAIGKSRPHIANMLRLLTLPKRAQDALQAGQISTGHARAVIAAPDPDALVSHIIDKGLSVREAESWVRRIKSAQNPDPFSVMPARAPEQKSADIAKLERDLADKLGVKATLNHKGPHGELRLRYADDAQLDRLLNILTR